MIRETGWYRIKLTKNSPNPILCYWNDAVEYWVTLTGTYRDHDIFQVYSGMVMTEDGTILPSHTNNITVQRDHVDAIDWNTASDFGLIFRINNEILHPLGLALCREVHLGTSPMIAVSSDDTWNYSEDLIEKHKNDSVPENWKDNISKLKNITYIKG